MKDVKVSEDGKTVYFTEKRKLNVVVDETAESPRNWDNLGTIVAWDRHYGFNEDKDNPIDFRNFNEKSALKYAKEIIKAGGFVCNLYCFEHSYVVLSTNEFDGTWERGQLGFVIVSKENLAKDKLKAKKDKEKIQSIIDNEIQYLNDYLLGAVYKIVDNAGIVDYSGYYGFKQRETAYADIERLGLTECIDKTYNG